MNVEQRLLRAFGEVDRVEPSADLWSRVVHSIDEDRAHRRRVVWSIVAAAAVVLGLLATGAAFVRDGAYGPYVERPVMEALELVGCIVVVVVMGPVVRRFGRNYAHDLLPTAHRVATTLLRLIDVAYYLVFTGYILMTTQFELELGVAGRPASRDLAQQLEEAAIRFGGLLLGMGVLHAATLVVLPVVALVHNSARRGRPLPRWMRNAGVLLVVLALWTLVATAGALLVAGVG
jgi:hypothetical protein